MGCLGTEGSRAVAPEIHLKDWLRDVHVGFIDGHDNEGDATGVTAFHFHKGGPDFGLKIHFPRDFARPYHIDSDTPSDNHALMITGGGRYFPQSVVACDKFLQQQFPSNYTLHVLAIEDRAGGLADTKHRPTMKNLAQLLEGVTPSPGKLGKLRKINENPATSHAAPEWRRRGAGCATKCYAVKYNEYVQYCGGQSFRWGHLDNKLAVVHVVNNHHSSPAARFTQFDDIAIEHSPLPRKLSCRQFSNLIITVIVNFRLSDGEERDLVYQIHASIGVLKEPFTSDCAHSVVVVQHVEHHQRHEQLESHRKEFHEFIRMSTGLTELAIVDAYRPLDDGITTAPSIPTDDGLYVQLSEPPVTSVKSSPKKAPQSTLTIDLESNDEAEVVDISDDYPRRSSRRSHDSSTRVSRSPKKKAVHRSPLPREDAHSGKKKRWAGHAYNISSDLDDRRASGAADTISRYSDESPPRRRQRSVSRPSHRFHSSDTYSYDVPRRKSRKENKRRGRSRLRSLSRSSDNKGAHDKKGGARSYHANKRRVKEYSDSYTMSGSSEGNRTGSYSTEYSYAPSSSSSTQQKRKRSNSSNPRKSTATQPAVTPVSAGPSLFASIDMAKSQSAAKKNRADESMLIDGPSIPGPPRYAPAPAPMVIQHQPRNPSAPLRTQPQGRPQIISSQPPLVPAAKPKAKSKVYPSGGKQLKTTKMTDSATKW